MKTSEFIKAWNKDLGTWQACKSHDGVIVKSKSTTLLAISNNTLEINPPCVLPADRINIINKYLQTPLNEREDERKWVIPWGKNSDDGIQVAWVKDTGIFFIDINCEPNWEKYPDYQFTDSEVERLELTQTPTIAQAIDMAKELVSDE